MSTQVVLTLNFASISLVPACTADTPIKTGEFFDGDFASTVRHMFFDLALVFLMEIGI
jgi:hypothetical protein